MRNQEPPQWNIKIPTFFYWSRTQEGKISLHTCSSQGRGNTVGRVACELRTWPSYPLRDEIHCNRNQNGQTSSTLISFLVFRIISQHMYANFPCHGKIVIVMSLLGKNLRPRLCPGDLLCQHYYFLRQPKSGFAPDRSISSTFWREKSYKPQSKNQGIVYLWIAHEAGNIVTKPLRCWWKADTCKK